METTDTQITKKNNPRFKSYYVVWKLTYYILHIFCIFRLNRTMQYGNKLVKDEATEIIGCLNRTMQYGNLYFSFFPASNLKSLNRTMQYGNTIWQLISVSPTFLFKSYYVVWKQNCFNQIHAFFILFKSYYVVWKPSNLARTPSVYFCLNRTMQYGNIKFSRLTQENKKVFKSYYVVWKQENITIDFEAIQLFKSYYVVWKLQTFRSIDFRYMLFKSYYVVWKRYEKPDNNSDRSRLNRTMQYGNLLAMSKNKRGSEFKSYYVVWKRKCRAQKYSFERRFKSYYVVWKQLPFDGVFRVDVGLNRTMQYGNLCQRIEDLPGIEEFKSYYVVWKLIF